MIGFNESQPSDRVLDLSEWRIQLPFLVDADGEVAPALRCTALHGCFYSIQMAGCSMLCAGYADGMVSRDSLRVRLNRLLSG